MRRRAKASVEPELPELERLDKLLGFNVTSRSFRRITLAARLANATTARYLREIVEAETERRLSGAAISASPLADERERAAG